MQKINSISVEGIFNAWREFSRGKTRRCDVAQYERHLERNIFRLYRELCDNRYEHGPYRSFFVWDPKIRHIRKAQVKDRIAQQLVYSELSRIFEPKFIHHSYSSRVGKGTHRAVKALRRMINQVSQNHRRPCWALKCDVRKFYDSVNHKILCELVSKKVRRRWLLKLVGKIVNSFSLDQAVRVGLPIGNVTSQVFTNIYLNELDQFVKHKLRAKNYIRFADDFILLSNRREDLLGFLEKIQSFLSDKLALEIHPQKITLRPISQGIDFLGYVLLPKHTVLRTKTRRRMLKRLRLCFESVFSGECEVGLLEQSFASYLGTLSHANCHELSVDLRNQLSLSDASYLK